MSATAVRHESVCWCWEFEGLCSRYSIPAAKGHVATVLRGKSGVTAGSSFPDASKNHGRDDLHVTFSLFDGVKLGPYRVLATT